MTLVPALTLILQRLVAEEAAQHFAKVRDRFDRTILGVRVRVRGRGREHVGLGVTCAGGEEACGVRVHVC